MQRILLFLVVIFIFQVASFGKAGGDITYKALGKDKYELTFKYYRDCRTSTGTLTFFLYTSTGGKTLSLSPTLKSIKDISTTCRTAAKCNPSNTQLSTTTPVFEQHTYKDTIDFNGNESSFKKYCFIKIFMAVCCRDSKINTGSGGSYFYLSSDLEICKVKNNSSPIFISDPVNTVGLNIPTFQLFNARDTVDNDSLSYHFTEPMDGLSSSVTWNKGYSYKEPLGAYWPSGYDKNKGPNPNVNPPIGIFLTQETGELIFVATYTDNTPLCIAVKEWRKDSTGKYVQIGEIRREVNLIVKSEPDNNPPRINGPYSYNICAGNQICFTISTDDIPYVPAPPAKAPPADTVSVTWNSVNINGATFTILDTTARLKKLKFCWTPKESDVNDIPYSFSVTAKDNHCPLNAITTKNYLVTVKSYAKTKVKINHVFNNLKVFESKVIQPFTGTPQYSWQVSDSSQKPLTNSYYFFKKSKLTYSSLSNDTVIFRKAGKYFVRHTINNSPSNCPTTYFDTLTIPMVLDVSFYKTKDTSVCKGVTLKFKAAVVNGNLPYTYKWGTVKPDTQSQLNYTSYRDTILELEVTDAKGQKAYSWCTVKVNKNTLDAGLDKTICKNDSVPLIAMASNFGGSISWSWFFNGNKIGNKNLIMVSDEGRYYAEAMDNTGCYLKDSVFIKNLALPLIKLYDSSYCQSKNSLTQKELIKTPSNINAFKSVQWEVHKTLKNPKGNENTLKELINDKDTSAGYDFLLAMDKSTIDLGTNTKDSLVFRITVTDNNKCKASSKGTFVIKKSPTLNFKYSQKTFCRSEVLDLDSLVTHDGDTQIWTKTNASGYKNYPATGNVKGGIIIPSDFYKEGGLYKINLMCKIGDCETNGTLNLDVLPNPVAVVEKKELTDSVVFIDRSLAKTTRSWYLDTVFISNADFITLPKKQANGKPITLRLANDKCNRDTVFYYSIGGITKQYNDFIQIFPNPVKKDLTIVTNQTKPFQIKILNTLGQVVLMKNLSLETETIDLSNLSRGVYTIVLETDNKISRAKFVKE